MCWQMDKDKNILVILVLFCVCVVHLTQPPWSLSDILCKYFTRFIPLKAFQWKLVYFPLLIHFISKIIP